MARERHTEASLEEMKQARIRCEVVPIPAANAALLGYAPAET